jgi:hypothetical protein
MKDIDVERPTLTFDYERYAPMLDDPALSEEDKKQALEALWTILVNLMELGITIEADKRTCGQNSQEANPASDLALHTVDCKMAFGASLASPVQIHMKRKGPKS